MVNLIILGMGPSRTDCPFDAETWGVNTGYRQIAQQSGRLDKLFICHRDQEYDWEGDPIFNWDEKNTLVDAGVEIVSLFKLKHIKKFTRMPFKDMIKRFKTDYYSDTICYMIAYALYLNTRINDKGLLELVEPMRIRMYGVDMHTRDEYATERGGIEHFVAIARTIGVDFWIHPDSSVCKTETRKPYGFFKLNRKVIDPHNILKLQKSKKGLSQMMSMGLISETEYHSMLEALPEIQLKEKRKKLHKEAI